MISLLYCLCRHSCRRG